MTFYEILEIPPTANLEQIKSAYRRLALLYHPDKNPNDPRAGEKFIRIHQAWETLRCPIKKAAYDSIPGNRFARPTEPNSRMTYDELLRKAKSDFDRFNTELIEARRHIETLNVKYNTLQQLYLNEKTSREKLEKTNLDLCKQLTDLLLTSKPKEPGEAPNTMNDLLDNFMNGPPKAPRKSKAKPKPIGEFNINEINFEKLDASMGRNGYPLAEIIELCRKLGLKSTGKKEECRDRIIRYLRDQNLYPKKEEESEFAQAAKPQ